MTRTTHFKRRVMAREGKPSCVKRFSNAARPLSTEEHDTAIAALRQLVTLHGKVSLVGKAMKTNASMLSSILSGDNRLGRVVATRIHATLATGVVTPLEPTPKKGRELSEEDHGVARERFKRVFASAGSRKAAAAMIGISIDQVHQLMKGRRIGRVISKRIEKAAAALAKEEADAKTEWESPEGRRLLEATLAFLKVNPRHDHLLARVQAALQEVR